MIKEDEIKLRVASLEKPENISFRQLGEALRIPTKRLCYLLNKWSEAGWYDYGVCIDLGWLTPLGMSILNENPIALCIKPKRLTLDRDDLSIILNP